MAKVIDENIQRQLDKKISFFVKYFPARIQNVGEDAKAARQLVWAFKDSRDSAYEKSSSDDCQALERGIWRESKKVWFWFVFRRVRRRITKADT